MSESFGGISTVSLIVLCRGLARAVRQSHPKRLRRLGDRQAGGLAFADVV
jgi:hypothetical protein